VQCSALLCELGGCDLTLGFPGTSFRHRVTVWSGAYPFVKTCISETIFLAYRIRSLSKHLSVCVLRALVLSLVGYTTPRGNTSSSIIGIFALLFFDTRKKEIWVVRTGECQ
jgi:hypothetical protein